MLVPDIDEGVGFPGMAKALPSLGVPENWI